MQRENKYELVIGLEVHARLLTRTKLFSAEPFHYGAAANTQAGPITLAHPGILPVLNKKALRQIIKLGIALGSEISKTVIFDRKHYFYPDLPKGYQITQHTMPVCSGGSIEIKSGGGLKTVRLNRIHLEEDAGKSLHDIYKGETAIDHNRAGTALAEMVTEPDIRSAEDARIFMNEVRKLLRYIDVCDGNMEEGSLRCDANISIREIGSTELGVRVEVKNLNSVRNLKRAIEFEEERMKAILETGGQITQETRGFDADTGITFSQREKEEAEDYRYFADPDLPAIELSNDFIEDIKREIPELQKQRIERYIQRWRLSDYDASLLSDDRLLAEYYEALVTDILKKKAAESEVSVYKSAANWMLGPVRSWMNNNGKDIEEFPLRTAKLADLIHLVLEGRVSFTAAVGLFDMMISQPDSDPLVLAQNSKLIQISDTGFLEQLVEQVLIKYPDKLKAYQKGKKGLLGFFTGEVMKKSEGRADPAEVQNLLIRKLKTD